MLIAFEGFDQSGKETQAQRLRERLREAGHKVRLLSFPDYGTSIGEEIARALQGEREYGADVMQLLFVANRHERREAILEWIAGGLILLCDRYRASSIAYGEAQGLDDYLARRHSALPSAGRPDDLHRHRTGNGSEAQSPRPGSLRIGPVIARARASKLSAPGRRAGLGSCRR